MMKPQEVRPKQNARHDQAINETFVQTEFSRQGPFQAPEQVRIQDPPLRYSARNVQEQWQARNVQEQWQARNAYEGRNVQDYSNQQHYQQAPPDYKTSQMTIQEQVKEEKAKSWNRPSQICLECCCFCCLLFFNP